MQEKYKQPSSSLSEGISPQAMQHVAVHVQLHHRSVIGIRDWSFASISGILLAPFMSGTQGFGQLICMEASPYRLDSIDVRIILDYAMASLRNVYMAVSNTGCKDTASLMYGDDKFIVRVKAGGEHLAFS